MLLLFDDLSVGAAYDILVLSELVALLLRRERDQIKARQQTLPTRNDIFFTCMEITN